MTTLISILGLSSFGCVSAGRHQRELAELEEAQENAARLEKEQRKQIATLQQRLHEQGTMAATLEELREQKLAAEEQAAIFKLLAKKLHGMIDEGDLTVTIRNGRMLLVLPMDVLFDTGKTEIKEGAREGLKQVAQALASIEGRRYEVAGHTDNVPINNRYFASNWELSTQRAVEVTKFLIANGLGPDGLSAAGFGEYDPVSSNDSAEGRAENRRIEITVLPKIEELPPHDDLT